MASKIIIIRGNSGSGKSTVAKKLQHKLGYGTMRIPQDVIRREILRVGDTDNNPSIRLIQQLAEYGRLIDYTVIIEGILPKKRYGKMLDDCIKTFDECFVYYFDIPFEETLRRHATKPNSNEYGEELMRQWWQEKDYLGTKNEIIVNESFSEDEIVDRIYSDVINLADNS